MARLNTQKPKQKKFPLTEHQTERLLYGCRLLADENSPGFADKMHERQSWVRYRKQLMKHYMSDQRNFASRPAGWWRYEVKKNFLYHTEALLFLLNEGHLKPVELLMAFKQLALRKVDRALITDTDKREQYDTVGTILADSEY